MQYLKLSDRNNYDCFIRLVFIIKLILLIQKQNMNKVQQEKKKEIASSLVELLKKLNLKDTADVLVEEAELLKDKNVEEDIKQILKEQSMDQKDRSLAIEQYCKYSIQNYLRQGKVDEALQIYEVILPMYCSNKIEQFSLLFAQTYDKDNQKITNLLESLLQQPKCLPENKVGCLNINNQIWYLKSLGENLLLIDCLSNAYIIQDNIVKCKKQKIHNDRIFTVTVCQQKFATGGTDKFVKIWDKTITLLYCIEIHKERINSIIMFNETVISFDNDAVICIHHIPSQAKLERKAIFKTAHPFLDVKYAKNKNKIVGVSKVGKFGLLSFVNIEKKRIQKILQIENRIYAIQISRNEKMIFANVAPAEIRAYSLSSKHDLLYTLTGFVQIKNLMRMSQGGKQDKYLAVTSEEGTVRIYSIKEQQEMLKLMGESKKSINCVLWRQQQLFFGCDGGNLQLWVNVGVNRATRRKRTLSSELTEEHETLKTKKIHAE